ncbi:Protein CLEC16A [Operophtera brumata]|uniref:Protein CLEC16A n=1 Tax=Operophtera brumata TaxID=104452 RepID=A0A0L7LSZ2_OPEBR|nr:Protein CLEC16A [Operophtera brumata]
MVSYIDRPKQNEKKRLVLTRIRSETISTHSYSFRSSVMTLMERARRAIRSFFLIRDLYLKLTGKAETQLPLTNAVPFVQDGNVLDLIWCQALSASLPFFPSRVGDSNEISDPGMHIPAELVRAHVREGVPPPLCVGRCGAPPVGPVCAFDAAGTARTFSTLCELEAVSCRESTCWHDNYIRYLWEKVFLQDNFRPMTQMAAL